MAAEMSITVGQLQELVDDVQKTKKTHTIHLADGVVVVVKPERKPATSRSGQRLRDTAPAQQRATKTYTLESAYGAVADSGGVTDFDRMIREAKEERADHLLKNM